MLRPLYLYTESEISVSLDGPALKISKSSCADRRYPFDRISRINVAGHVSWSTEALLKCADLGIVVSFLNSDGSFRAVLNSKSLLPSEFQKQWNDLLEHRDWTQLFESWCKFVYQQVHRFCAWRLGWQTPYDLDEFEDKVSLALNQMVNENELKMLESTLFGLVQTRVVQELVIHNIDNSSQVGQLTIPVFIQAVWWGIQPDIIFWLKSKTNKNTDFEKFNSQVLVTFFEKQNSVISFHINDVKLRLFRFLLAVKFKCQ